MKKYSPQKDTDKRVLDETNFNKKKVEKKKHYEKPDFVDLGFEDEDELREYERFLR